MAELEHVTSSRVHCTVDHYQQHFSVYLIIPSSNCSMIIVVVDLADQVPSLLDLDRFGSMIIANCDNIVM